MSNKENIPDNKSVESDVCGFELVEYSREASTPDESSTTYEVPGKGYRLKYSATFGPGETYHDHPRPFCCCVCNIKYANRHQLYVHNRTKHADGLFFECSLCYKELMQNKCFITADELHEHSARHRPEDFKYACKYCDDIKNSYLDLLSHIYETHSNRPFKRFSTPKTLLYQQQTP